jgi:hypothetical protein
LKKIGMLQWLKSSSIADTKRDALKNRIDS